MKAQIIQELRTDSIAEMLEAKHKTARQAVDKRLVEMVESGEVNILTDEEERLLRSFRRFKASCKAGSIFRWQTRPVEGVTISQDKSLIRDPQEVS